MSSSASPCLLHVDHGISISVEDGGPPSPVLCRDDLDFPRELIMLLFRFGFYDLV
jgi:hypothetical protein